MDFGTLKKSISAVVDNTDSDNDSKLKAICQLLFDSVPYYNWVGFYFADHQTNILHLGPYVGALTDHTLIPFGKGICGQVAVSNKNFVVPDVAAQDNYLACSTTVKAEIVIPIFVDGINMGQLDIDSHQLNPFTEKDVLFLEFVTQQVAGLF
jgi:GAF domain-containing protein